VHDDLVVRPLGDRRHRLRRVGHHVQRGGYPPGGIRTGALWRTLNVDAVSRADAFVREGWRSPGTSALGATRCEDGGAIAAPNGLESETPRRTWPGRGLTDLEPLASVSISENRGVHSADARAHAPTPSTRSPRRDRTRASRACS
jgi:hypothetical protein